MRRSRLTVVAAFVVGFAFLFLVAYHALFSTDWGRARVCAQIERSVSSQMQGKLSIERIAAIDLPYVDAREVRIIAPDGVPAIDVERARIEFDFASFLSGDFAWQRAEIENGLVRVTEDARGRVNMDETFKGPAAPDTQPEQEGGAIDMRTMVTSNMRLLIGGGSLPRLRLIDIHGIMRVQVSADGTTQIRFDDYRGHFVDGLPNGQLKFQHVKGHVQTGHKRLLRFTGDGHFQGERVAFDLDIFTEPERHVKIDAYFPELSAAGLSTLGVAAWSKATGSTLDIRVRHGK